MLLKNNLSTYILVCNKGYRTMTSGWVARGTVFREVRPGAGFKTGDFVKEKLGGGYRRTTLLRQFESAMECLAISMLCVQIA